MNHNQSDEAGEHSNMVYLYCQNCEFTKEVSDKFLGTKGKCPQCSGQAEAISSIPEDNQNGYHTNIDALNVNDSWKQKFRIIEKMGAEEQSIYSLMNSPAFKALSFKEKRMIDFNLWAFFFGPFYYFVKKMWLKGAVLFGGITLLNTLLTIVEIVFDMTLPPPIYWIPGAVLCAQLANLDYFRFKIHQEMMWKPLALFSKPVQALTFPVAAIVLMLVISLFSPPTTAPIQERMLTDVSGVWSDNADGTLVKIDLVGNKKSVTIADKRIPVSVDNIDTDKYIIDLKIRYKNGKSTIWKFQQHYQDDGRFTLSMNANGVQGGLSFVRNI